MASESEDEEPVTETEATSDEDYVPGSENPKIRQRRFSQFNINKQRWELGPVHVQNSVNGEGQADMEEENNANPKNKSINKATNAEFDEHEDTEETRLNGNPSLKYPTRYSHGTYVRKTYKCWFCPTVCYELKWYLSHKAAHFKKSAYQCDKCTFSTCLERTLNKHEICHTLKYFYGSGPRNKPARKLLSSFRPLHGTQKYVALSKWRNNGIITSSANGMNGSITGNTGYTGPNVNVGVNKHKCSSPNCPSAFQRTSDLTRHMRRHNSNTSGRFQCNLCSYSVLSKCFLERHLLLHQNQGSTSGSSQNIQQRRRATGPAASLVGDKHRRFKCKDSNCPEMYYRKLDLVRHTPYHDVTQTQTRRFKCGLCSYSVNSSSRIRSHKLAHVNSRSVNGNRDSSPSLSPSPNFNCEAPNCPHRFQIKTALVNHMRVHNRTGKLKCSLCSYSANLYAHFRRHKRLHENDAAEQRPAGPGPWRRQAVKAGQRPARPAPWRRQAVKAGLITQDELNRIKIGNPKFTYKLQRKAGNGELRFLHFRCLLCPKSFQGFSHWTTHQISHGNRIRRYDCKQKFCKYKTFYRENFVKHSLTHDSNSKHSSEVNHTVEFDKFALAKEPAPAGTSDNCQASRQIKALTNLDLVTVRESTENVTLRSKKPTPVKEIGGLHSLVEEESRGQGYLISSIGICNFMGITEKHITPTANLCGVQGILNGGDKTTTIIGCLVGIGYDIVMDLPENSTLCGVDISNVLRVGQSFGYIEVTLNLKPFEELRRKYGNQLKLKRNFRQGVPLAESEIEIFYRNVCERITRSQLKQLVCVLMPAFVLRVMVFTTENVQYLAENFHLWNEIFWKLAEKRKASLLLTQGDIAYRIEQYKHDLDSRNLRITYLQENLLSDFKGIPDLRRLQVAQAIELQTALEQRRDVEGIHKKLVQEQTELKTQIANQLTEMMDKLRSSFQNFLQSQNYMGDLVLSVGESTKEVVIWIKEASPLQSVPGTIDEARQIRKCLTLARRKLAATGLFLAFWRVLDCCPIMLGDVYSSSELEFQLSEPALRILVDIARQESTRQFIVSVPGETAEEFKKRLT